ncbi:class I SAM-dependent methyltransferase, partial [Pseudomonas syringae group genomosp. 7]|uniref:class I SAM-dependent methyltransferase n=1 Tax=Pseudomonas syringae group genomosp. 7 TaxID=251699 RepID=UPI00376FD78A
MTRQLAERHGRSGKWVGIDVEEAMTQQANQSHGRAPISNVTFVTDEILTFPYEKIDFIVAYY